MDNPTDPITGAIRRLGEARRRATTALVEPAPPRPVVREPATSGRAGRNLPSAIAVGLGLLAVVGLSLFIRREAFVVLAVAAVCMALWELAGAVSQRHIRIPVLPLWVGAVGIEVSAWMAGEEAMLMAFALTCGGVFVWRILDGVGMEAVRDAAAGIFAAAYVAFLAGFASRLLAADRGSWPVLTGLLVAVANDVGGYVAGVFFGRTPMAPTISPKKSWEGAVGSLLLTCGVATTVLVLILGAPWWGGVALGVAAVAA